jgi:hypothetical protein
MPYRPAGTRNGQVCDLAWYAIHHAIVCFSLSRVYRPSDQFILRDPCTDELLNNCPLPFSPTEYTTGLCLPHLFHGDLRGRESVSQPFIPPSAIRAVQPRSRLPYNGRLHISLGLRSCRPRRALTTSIAPTTASNSGSACQRWRWRSALSTRIGCRPSCALHSSPSVCFCWCATSTDGIHVGVPSATA